MFIHASHAGSGAPWRPYPEIAEAASQYARVAESNGYPLAETTKELAVGSAATSAPTLWMGQRQNHTP